MFTQTTGLKSIPLYGRALLACCCWLLACPGAAQQGSSVPESSGVSELPFYRISRVIITGNVKTKSVIIERELPFHSGEQYSPEDLVKKMDMARRQLMNTSLFHKADVSVDAYDDSQVTVRVAVKERWYFFPMPYFVPADRNLNQWLVEQKGSFDRVNYGVKLNWNNPTGRNDMFRLWLIGGYTRQISFNYDRLYIDKKLRWGAGVSFAHGKNREIQYNTLDDKQVFFKDPGQFVRRFTKGQFSISYRPAINTRHSFGIGYTREEVGDTIMALNPEYFQKAQRRISYPGLFYTLNWFNLDYIPYPTKGYAAQVILSKDGFNSSFNLWQLHFRGLANWTLFPKTFLHLNTYGGIKLPFDQPYFNRRFLGFRDAYMQGYEYNVTDGVAGGFLKTTISRELTRFQLRVPQGKRKDPLAVPFRIFGRVYGNTGYVYNPDPGNNRLSNRMLITGGIGIDIVTAYDLILRFDWSFNQFGQNGLFLHRKTIFE